MHSRRMAETRAAAWNDGMVGWGCCRSSGDQQEKGVGRGTQRMSLAGVGSGREQGDEILYRDHVTSVSVPCVYVTRYQLLCSLRELDHGNWLLEERESVWLSQRAGSRQ